MKTDLLSQMTSSVKTLEKEITGIRSEQSKLQDIGKRSTSEQRVLEQKLAESEKMLADYKDQWSKQLTQHADSVQTIVAKSVAEALSKRKSEQDSFT